MRQVKVNKLIECLSNEDRNKLNELICQLDDNLPEINDNVAIYCQSSSMMIENKIICSNTIDVDIESLKILAAMVKRKKQKININFNIIRPDVLNFIESDAAKYKPIIPKYSYTLPNIIGTWTKPEY